MPAEIVAAVAAANQAFNFIKKAVHKGKEVQDLTKAIGKFWDAREEVSVLEQKAKTTSKIGKLLGTSSVESQALEATLQKQKAEQLEKELKNLFYWTGNANLWHDMLRERSRIRNLRIAEAKKAAETRAAIIDISVVLGCVITAMFVFYLVSLIGK